MPTIADTLRAAIARHVDTKTAAQEQAQKMYGQTPQQRNGQPK